MANWKCNTLTLTISALAFVDSVHADENWMKPKTLLAEQLDAEERRRQELDCDLNGRVLWHVDDFDRLAAEIAGSAG
jgi:predicted KAP-like P-loop ATPase